MPTSLLETASRSFTTNQRVADLAADAQSKGIKFYLASNDAIKDAFDREPLGVKLNYLDFMRTNPEGWSTTHFLTLVNRANGLAFGPRGLPMPNWVMIDLALMPSAMVIATASREFVLDQVENGDLKNDQREVLELLIDDADAADYHGPLPIAGYCAAPTADRMRWAGWSLWSILPGANLGLVTRGLALAAYRAKYVDGVTQFDNLSLRVLTQFGPLRVRSAKLELHTAANSFAYECEVGANATAESAPSFLLDPTDVERQQQMQAAIEAGTHDFFVVAPGVLKQNGRSYVPIVEVDRSAPEVIIDVSA